MIKIGVIGYGYWGPKHARNFHELGGAELRLVADVNGERLEQVRAMYPWVECTRDYRELLESDVEAVVVATPVSTHYRIAREALIRGKHVLVEKPMTRTLAEADDLVAVAAAGGRILQVGHSERFNGAVQALAKLVQDPGFIEVHRMGPFPGRGTDVDVVLDLMIHDIDIVLNLVKSPVTSVSAVGVPVISEQVDIANARLEFASGCVANLTASRVSGERLRKIRVFQRDTSFVLDYANQELHLFREVAGDGSGKARLARIEVPVARVEPLREELEGFLESVRTRRPPLISGEAGRRAVAVATQIIERL
jgi:predicted dehydrogenase